MIQTKTPFKVDSYYSVSESVSSMACSTSPMSYRGSLSITGRLEIIGVSYYFVHSLNNRLEVIGVVTCININSLNNLNVTSTIT